MKKSTSANNLIGTTAENRIQEALDNNHVIWSRTEEAILSDLKNNKYLVKVYLKEVDKMLSKDLGTKVPVKIKGINAEFYKISILPMKFKLNAVLLANLPAGGFFLKNNKKNSGSYALELNNLAEAISKNLAQDVVEDCYVFDLDSSPKICLLSLNRFKV